LKIVDEQSAEQKFSIPEVVPKMHVAPEKFFSYYSFSH
jgi:hypothetical protein